MPETLPGCDTLSRGGFDEVRLLLIGLARSTASSWSGVSSNLLNSFALSLWVCDPSPVPSVGDESFLISHSHAFAAGKSGVWNTVEYSKGKRERTAARHENGKISFVPVQPKLLTVNPTALASQHVSPVIKIFKSFLSCFCFASQSTALPRSLPFIILLANSPS